MLCALVRDGRSLAETAGALQLWPQVLINVPIADRAASLESPGVAAAVVEAQSALGQRGRVLLRPSGTEPLVRVMVEADDEPLARRWAESIAGAVRAAVPGAD